jgi:hypothetical protein
MARGGSYYIHFKVQSNILTLYLCSTMSPSDDDNEVSYYSLDNGAHCLQSLSPEEDKEEGGHLTINKVGRWQQKSGGGGADGRMMTTDDDNDGRVTPKRRCPHLRMRTSWHDDDWHHSLLWVNVAGICGAL